MKSRLTIMKAVREFSGWQDELSTLDNALVIVHEDGSVNSAISGDMICGDGFQSSDIEAEWARYWEF